MKDIRYLSETIGPRVAGTAEEHQAAGYIAQRMQEIGLDVSMQPFHFLNWRPLSPPHLQVLSPEPRDIPLASMHYSLSTPPSGVSGVLKKIGKMTLVPNCAYWEKYVIIDPERPDVDLGFVVKCAHDQGSPFPTGWPLLPESGAILGKKDGEMIDGWLEQGHEVRVCLYNDGAWEQSMSQNVIGRLGEGPPQLLITGHYDSAFYAPGAVDNGSGIQVMLDLAEKLLLSGRPLPPLALVAMGAEEPGLLGSKYYVKNMLERLDPQLYPRYCVNFDMLASGEKLMLRMGGQAMEEQVAALLEEKKSSLRCEVGCEPAKPVSDNWPFHEVGIANVHFVAVPFSLYHLDRDVMTEVDPLLLSEAERLGEALLERLIARLL